MDFRFPSPPPSQGYSTDQLRALLDDPAFREPGFVALWRRLNGMERGLQTPDLESSTCRLTVTPLLWSWDSEQRLKNRPPQSRDTASVLAEIPAHERANIVPLRRAAKD